MGGGGGTLTSNSYRFAVTVFLGCQVVGDEKKFLRTFSQLLKDCFGQSWHDKLESSDRFFEYKLMKQNFGMEEYIIMFNEGSLERRITKV